MERKKRGRGKNSAECSLNLIIHTKNSIYSLQPLPRGQPWGCIYMDIKLSDVQWHYRQINMLLTSILCLCSALLQFHSYKWLYNVMLLHTDIWGQFTDLIMNWRAEEGSGILRATGDFNSLRSEQLVMVLRMTIKDEVVRLWIPYVYWTDTSRNRFDWPWLEGKYLHKMFLLGN